ncbi:MAG: TIGR02444 family protein [Alphaproteobacteria bacterium]|nr:MAG: TIGR02444 family protein [Alphaproteobacteria bacterium]
MRQQKHGKPEVYANAFWRFSLALYARPGVAEALIALQDRAGNDVNLILFALWRGVVHGHRLDQGELTAAEAAIAPLRRDVIEPLRKLRRGLKDNSDPDLQALRRRIGGLELAAERRAQSRVAATIAAPGAAEDRAAAAAANLALYLGATAQSAEAAVLRRALRDFLTRG